MKSVLAAVITCFAVSTASATEFVVTKTADTADGTCDTSDCSLREAVIAANGQAGDDVITLPAGLYVLTHEGSGEDAAATGDLDVTETLTLNGEDAATTTVHGGGGFLADPDRIFEVSGAASLTVNHLTLRNGTPPLGSGGAIAASGTGNLTVDSCDLVSNTLVSSSSGGAVSYNGSGSIPLPEVLISKSRILNNTAIRFGGGVFANDVVLTIRESEISGNTTSIQGGGFSALKSDTTVSDSVISNNFGGDLGGGIGDVLPLSDDSTITITNTVISGNHAGDAGGVGKKGGELTLEEVTLEDNKSDGIGGGAAFSGERLSVSGNSIVRGNVAVGDGGGIVTEGDSPTSTAEITDTVFEENASNIRYGGGLFVLDMNATLSNLSFRANFAERGGGLMVSGSSAVGVADSTFDANGASAFGGGLYDDANAPLSIARSTFSGNVSQLGGGILFLSASDLNIENSTFSGNDGSAVANTGNATVTNATFVGNSSLVPGAALVGTGAVTIANSALVSETGDNCQHPIVSGGHNLDADGSCGLAFTGDQNVDPQLGPLADNGGPTFTHAPLPGSPAVDGGDNALCPATDQRDISRPLDGDVDGTAACDVGAVELTACGDGVVQTGEECDDGNAADGDDCNADCTLPEPGGTTGGTSGGTTTGGTSGGATGSVEDASGGCSLIPLPAGQRSLQLVTEASPL